MLIVVWLTSTALATGMAFVAVSLVLAGVSGQRAEQLRFGANCDLRARCHVRPHREHDDDRRQTTCEVVDHPPKWSPRRHDRPPGRRDRIGPAARPRVRRSTEAWAAPPQLRSRRRPHHERRPSRRHRRRPGATGGLHDVLDGRRGRDGVVHGHESVPRLGKPGERLHDGRPRVGAGVSCRVVRVGRPRLGDQRALRRWSSAARARLTRRQPPQRDPGRVASGGPNRSSTSAPPRSPVPVRSEPPDASALRRAMSSPRPVLSRRPAGRDGLTLAASKPCPASSMRSHQEPARVGDLERERDTGLGVGEDVVQQGVDDGVEVGGRTRRALVPRAGRATWSAPAPRRAPTRTLPVPRPPSPDRSSAPAHRPAVASHGCLRRPTARAGRAPRTPGRAPPRR